MILRQDHATHGATHTAGIDRPRFESLHDEGRQAVSKERPERQRGVRSELTQEDHQNPACETQHAQARGSRLRPTETRAEL